MAATEKLGTTLVRLAHQGKLRKVTTVKYNGYILLKEGDAWAVFNERGARVRYGTRDLFSWVEARGLVDFDLK